MGPRRPSRSWLWTPGADDDLRHNGPRRGQKEEDRRQAARVLLLGQQRLQSYVVVRKIVSLKHFTLDSLAHPVPSYIIASVIPDA